MEAVLVRFLVAFQVACLSVFFQKCLDNGMIFGFYKNFLTAQAEKSQIFSYFSKPLGLCWVCNGTWIAIMVYLSVFSLASIADLAGLFLFIGLVYVYQKIYYLLIEILEFLSGFKGDS